MTLRNGTITYSQTSGILLAGYAPRTNAVGMDNFGAPGFGFVMGQQNHDLSGDIVRDFATTAAQQGWLVNTPSIFNPYTNTRNETINARLSLEPFRGLRVELMANRTKADNNSSFFRYNRGEQRYVNDSPRDQGSFSVSMLNWRTAFVNNDGEFVNQVFQDMLANRTVIQAHRELEKLVLSGKQLFWKESLGNLYGSLLHEGHYFDPIRRDLEAFLASSQATVTGDVRMTLYPRVAQIEGVRSVHSLMQSKVASYGEGAKAWTGEEARGYCKLFGIGQQVALSARERSVSGA